MEILEGSRGYSFFCLLNPYSEAFSNSASDSYLYYFFPLSLRYQICTLHSSMQPLCLEHHHQIFDTENYGGFSIKINWLNFPNVRKQTSSLFTYCSQGEWTDLGQAKIRRNSMVNRVEIWNLGPPDYKSITLATQSQT